MSADRPLYVLSKDAKHNTVLLGRRRGAIFLRPARLARELDHYAARRAAARHRQNALFPARKRATVTPLDGGAVRVDFDEPQRAITAGQAVVFYRGDVVAGGATIDKAL